MSYSKYEYEENMKRMVKMNKQRNMKEKWKQERFYQTGIY